MKRLALLCLFLLPLLLSAQSYPGLLWRYDLPSPAFGSAAAADVDGDGFLEIIFTTYTNDGKVHCLNAEDGTQRWEYSIGGCGDVAPLIYDFDSDDTLDVFVNGSCNPTCFCINAMTGALKWSRASGGGDSPPTVGDIDEDGKPEILFGNFSGQVIILNAEDGSPNRTVTFAPGIGAIQSEPTLGDLDGDNDLEFIACNYFNNSGHYTWAYDYDTDDTLWTNFKFDTTSSFYAYHGGVLADIDQDSLPEYVVGDNAGMIRALNAEDGSLLWFKTGLTNVISALSCANLDSDPALEILYSNNDYVNFNDHIGVLDGSTGMLEWSYPLTFSAFRGVAISDINGNGKLDCVSGHFMGELIALEPFTGLIWNYNTDTLLPPGLPYWDVDHGPLVADFDHDGNMDVFAVVGYGTYVPDSQNVGVAFCVRGGPNPDGCPEWLMFRQDVTRSGYLSSQDIQANCAVLSTTAASQATIVLYPNPASDRVVVEFTEPLEAPATLAIHDLQGHCLHTAAVTSPETTIDINLPTGMYFWRLEASGGALGTGKLIVVR